MTAMCHPLSDDLATSLLSSAARALCVRPDEPQTRYEERARHLTHTAMDLAPRDSLELMLAILVAGQFDLILDAARDVHAADSDVDKRRAHASLAALERSMLSMVRRLRAEQKRPMEPIQAPEEAAARVSEAATSPAPALAATSPPPALAATGLAPAVAAPDPALSTAEPEHAMFKPAPPARPVPPATPSNKARLNTGVAAIPPISPPLAAIGRVPPLAPFRGTTVSQGVTYGASQASP